MAKYLISGGGFRNNGVESMLFTLISELKEYQPDCEIYVLLNKLNSDDVSLANPIASQFLNHNVYILDKKYNCIEFEQILHK